MGENTEISWTTHTWNAWWGCQKVGPGCDHCYAEALDKRTGGDHWGPHAQRRRTSAANWKLPFKWDREAQRTGIRPRVFGGSMNDPFDNAVPPEWRVDYWEVIRQTPHLDWQILTKRIGNVPDMLPPGWPVGFEHVGIMITVVNQQEADRDIPKLLKIGAPWCGLSMEPLLGPVDIRPFLTGSEKRRMGQHNAAGQWDEGEYLMPCARLDWVIVGGESGHHARPMHPQWARDIRDACQDAGVAFHYKQHGEWVKHKPVAGGDLGADVRRGTVTIVHPSGESNVDVFNRTGRNTIPGSCYMRRVGKKAAGRHLDGRTWDEFPKPRAQRAAA